MRGVYGSGNDRVARLQAAGYNPAEVQSAVNSRVAVQAPRISAPASAGYVQRSTSGYVVRRGDTLGHIALRNGWYSGTGGLFGSSGYTQRLAERNGIANRGLIYPGQRIQP
ncbi:LysM peptidoglycan-binding domain-containing protein [Candidatus Saccharibacteria bacterium]|nr:LysM peptidoglycan-binding domain-containing protein [Candidatus Saccharibacteria bacterium]